MLVKQKLKQKGVKAIRPKRKRKGPLNYKKTQGQVVDL